MNDSEKLFPLEKITSMSAYDYCDSQNKKLSDYEIRPIHARLVSRTVGDSCPDTRELLARRVPEAAEIVTDYQAQIAMNNYLVLQYATGTALIPKPKEELPKQELPDTGGPVVVRRFG